MPARAAALPSHAYARQRVGSRTQVAGGINSCIKRDEGRKTRNSAILFCKLSRNQILRLVPKPCLQTALHQALELLLAHLVEQQLERELDERDLLRGEGLLQAARQRLPDLPA